MGLYTQIDKQIVDHYEVVSIHKSLSNQNFYLRNLVLLFSISNVFVIINEVVSINRSILLFVFIVFVIVE